MTTPRALKLRMVIGVLALLGLLVAVYLALFELELSGSLVCPNSGCETVNQSDYVHMFGIPIAVLGVIGYTVILVVTLGWTTREYLVGQIAVRWALLGMSVLGFAFSLFLTYLEAFKINAYCTWCLISAGLMTVIRGVSLALWPAEDAPIRLWGK